MIPSLTESEKYINANFDIHLLSENLLFILNIIFLARGRSRAEQFFFLNRHCCY